MVDNYQPLENVLDIFLGSFQLSHILADSPCQDACRLLASTIIIEEFRWWAHCRGEQLLKTHTLIGQEVQLPSSDWTRAISCISCPIRT